MSISTPVSPALRPLAFCMGIAVCLMPFIAAFAPRFFAFAPGLMAVGAIAAYWQVCRRWPEWPRLYLIIVMGICSLCALSSIWSLNPPDVIKKAGGIFFILASGCVLYGVCKAIDTQTLVLRATVGRYFPFALIFALVFVVLDLVMQGVFYFLFREPEARFNPSHLNRPTIALLFMAPAALWLVWENQRPRLWRLVVGGVLSAIFLTLFIKTDSQTAQIAVLVFVALTFAFPYRRKIFWLGLGVVIFSAVLSTPWAVQMMFDQFVHSMRESVWLQRAFAAERLEIWDFIARRALEQPLLGFGLEAASYTEHFDSQKIYVPLDHVLHPHNFALQIWLEFGAVGAVLAGAAILAVLKAIYQWGPENARRMLPLFIGVLCAAATSYGLWQGWWLGLFTLLPVLSLLTTTKTRT
jgi:O-antigen ligase